MFLREYGTGLCFGYHTPPGSRLLHSVLHLRRHDFPEAGELDTRFAGAAGFTGIRPPDRQGDLYRGESPCEQKHRDTLHSGNP